MAGRGFYMADETFSSALGSGLSCAKTLREQKEAGKRLMASVADGAAVVGVAGLLGWYQGRSGGTMPEILSMDTALLTGLALGGVGLYMTATESAADADKFDYGRLVTSAGAGAFAWLLGSYLQGVGQAQHDEAGGTAVPATAGWNHLMGEGNRYTPQSVGVPSYAGYGGFSG